MQIILTCAECGHQEWGRSDAILMNKIKIFNHASKRHPEVAEQVLERSVPHQPFHEILQTA